MYVVIDISHLINNYPLGSKGFSNWVSFHLEMILDIGVIFIGCNHCSFVSQVIGVKDKLNCLFMVTLVSVHISSTSNMQQKGNYFYTNA